MEKALQADFYKSQKEFLSDLSESLGEMKSIMKSIKDEISVLRDQPMPFRSVDKGAVLENHLMLKQPMMERKFFQNQYTVNL